MTLLHGKTAFGPPYARNLELQLLEKIYGTWTLFCFRLISRISIYAERAVGWRPSACPSVRHTDTDGSVKNGWESRNYI